LLIRLAEVGLIYRVFSRVTSGKKREVSVPCGDLLTVHNRLFTLLDEIRKPAYLHSGVKACSPLSNAAAHRGDEPGVTIDIRKFFPSIDTPRIHRVFRRQLACTPPVADLLTRLCTFRGHVPIGSRMSQHLAYFAARPMLDDLHRLSMRQGVVFTCYVDDLSLSGAAATPAFLWRVKQVMHHHGLRSHNGRCHQPGQPKTITGVVVAADTLRVPKRNLEQIQHDLHQIEQLRGDEQDRLLGQLIGRLAVAASIDPLHRKAHRLAVEQRRALRPQHKPDPVPQKCPPIAVGPCSLSSASETA
jgi:hypothetical protein